MDAVKSLKLTEVRMFELFLKRVQKGYFDDYSDILELIMFIECLDKLDNFDSYYEYYNGIH